jgi:hypothetical protein
MIVKRYNLDQGHAVAVGVDLENKFVRIRSTDGQIRAECIPFFVWNAMVRDVQDVIGGEDESTDSPATVGMGSTEQAP